MKISKDQWKQVEEVNERVKSLDPILKKRIVDIELREIFGDDYLEILPSGDIDEIDQKSVAESAIVEVPLSIKGRNESIPSIKDFFDAKKPESAIETVTVFGYYFERYEKLPEFAESDISRAYYEARVRKPKVIGQAIRDARNIRGYLVEGSKRGRFRLSNVGENLVLHDLPKKAK